MHNVNERVNFVDILCRIFRFKVLFTHRKAINLPNKKRVKMEKKKRNEKKASERVTHFKISIIIVP